MNMKKYYYGYILERARTSKDPHRKSGPRNGGAHFSPFCKCQTSSHVNVLPLLPLKICQLIHFEANCLKELHHPIAITQPNLALWRCAETVRNSAETARRQRRNSAEYGKYRVFKLNFYMFFQVSEYFSIIPRCSTQFPRCFRFVSALFRTVSALFRAV